MDPAELQKWLTLAAILLIGAAVLGSLASGAFELRRAARRKGRLLAAGPSGGAPASPSGLMLGLSGAARRLGEQAAMANPSQLSALRSRLVRAGFFNRDAVVIYLGIRAAAMLAATIGTVLTMPLAIARGGDMAAMIAALLMIAAALFAPDQVLKTRQTAREREYADGFPDLLDLLVASVEAGLSLDAAVARVGDELERRYPSLTTHLRMLTLELRAGRSRKDAWAALADRLGIEDARALATMLRQSEEMGTSLSETLAAFAGDMRAKRMLRAEAKALALPAKLTVPLILFIFPCLLAVVMIPAVFKAMAMMKGG
ncbi:MAG TPA: type II secretion system F family protein [Phenylobacterium sp.]|nr:type II secretion system F family protein [Phenylobacterium sp.]